MSYALILIYIYFGESCDVYSGCMDETACNYDVNVLIEDGSCFYPNECGNCDDDLSCCSCTDSEACNFNTDATIDDSSCFYPQEYEEIAMGIVLMDTLKCF